MITNIGSTNLSSLLGASMQPAKGAGNISSDLAQELKQAGMSGALNASDAPQKSAIINLPTAPAGASFSNLIDHAVSEVDGKMKAADVQQAKVLTGETSNLHQAMISIQEANVAFSLMVEVRNKLVDSYQELMRMQV